MSLLTKLKEFGTSEKKLFHTKYGDFNLAKKNDVQKLKKIVIDLQRTTDALTRKDLQDWRRAWQYAINVDYPNRQKLYDIYQDVDVDLHLTGCIQQRQGFVMSRSFKLVKPDGTEDLEKIELLNAKWFRDLLKYSLESIYWGHSLIELGDVNVDGNGKMYYSDVELIPRKHVIPEHHCFVTDLGMNWTSGVDYTQPPFSDWVLAVGGPKDLGLFLKAATQTIPKKNVLSFWDTFAEIFGMPMRIAKTSSRNKEDLEKIAKTMQTMGAALYGVFQEGTEIDVVENSKPDAFKVYDQRIDRANKELSKLTIGQTMTIEDGSSLSQSQTHLKVFENLVESDCDMIRDMVNHELLPRMIRHGFPVEGLRFDWDYSVDYTPEQQLAYEATIAQLYEVDPKYFAEKYSMPVGERRNVQPQPGNMTKTIEKPFFD